MMQYLQLPEWLPWWAVLAVLVPVALYGLLFVAMPFSVFGIKPRLESIEARLDDIQGDIRSLALRLPERGGPSAADLDPPPPIPPARADRGASGRAEPRLDWPR